MKKCGGILCYFTVLIVRERMRLDFRGGLRGGPGGALKHSHLHG